MKSDDRAGRAVARHPRRGQRSLLCDAGAAEVSQDRSHRSRGDPRGRSAAGNGAARHRLYAGRRGTQPRHLGRRAARRARPVDAAWRHSGRGLSCTARSTSAPNAKASWSRDLPPAPSLTRANALGQYLFVNGRPVRDKLILGAVRAAYADYLPRDRHPVVALFVMFGFARSRRQRPSGQNRSALSQCRACARLDRACAQGRSRARRQAHRGQ